MAGVDASSGFYFFKLNPAKSGFGVKADPCLCGRDGVF